MYGTPGPDPDDFPVVPAESGLNGKRPAVRLIHALRGKLGARLSWDQAQHDVTRRIESLRDRLPRDLRREVSGAAVVIPSLTVDRRRKDQYVSDMVNKTGHELWHLGWVPAAEREFELRSAAVMRPAACSGGAPRPGSIRSAA